MIDQILTGKTDTHLILDTESQYMIHKDVQPALDRMRSMAAQDGFKLKLTSCFRGFDAQLKIWNAKARGERTLYDSNGLPMEYSTLSPREIVFAILRWSALPGASRHHWGTDMDVYDTSRMPEGYQVELLPQEYAKGGVFSDFNIWMNDNLSKFDFFRPYDVDRGGIAPEAWHISYAPISNLYMQALTFEMVQNTIVAAEIELKDEILRDLPEIYQRFILV